jgi:lysophospholipase L1-like esterase
MLTRVLARVGLVLIGLAMAVLLLELSLQLGSLFVDAPIEPGTMSWKAGDHRILALGDSNTYGVWLRERDRESYPAQLERIWNDGQRPPAHVLNLGYPGTNSSRLLGLYPEFIDAFDPDVALVMIGVNDFWTEPVALPDEQEDAGLLAYLRRHSRLYKGLYILLRRSGADGLKVEDAPDSEFDRGEGTIRAGTHEFAVGWTTEIGNVDEVEAGLRENLRILAAASKRSSVQLVLMTYPGRFEYYGFANPVIRAIAQESGIPLIDLTPVFRPLCPEFDCPQWLYEDQHPKEAGYRLVAETITARLAEMLR